jgi:hypothetical protein
VVAASERQRHQTDNAENSYRANTQLATGGFLIGDSDLRGPLGHVNEEISSYYEVTFNPNIQKSEVRWKLSQAKGGGGER